MAHPLPSQHACPATIVLIDDDPDDLWVLERALLRGCAGRCALAIEKFQDPAKALEWIATGTDAGNTLPELLIIDFNMPRFSGLDLVRKLRRTTGFTDVPLLILTTADGRPLSDEVLQAGADAIYTKPDTMEGLTQLASDVIATWLRVQTFADGRVRKIAVC